MESEGERGGSSTSNPSATFAALLIQRQKLQQELHTIEKQVYDLETSYLQDSSQCGNVSKGFENILSSSRSTTKKLQPQDRLFSLSSMSSPAVRNLDSNVNTQ